MGTSRAETLVVEAQVEPGGRRPRSLLMALAAVGAVVVGAVVILAILSSTPPGPGIDLEEVVEEPAMLGREVTLAASVQEVYEPRLFAIGHSGFLGLFESDRLLVIVPDDVAAPDVSVGDDVVVRGVVERPVEHGVPSEILDELEDQPFLDAEILTSLVAMEVVVD